MELFLTRRAAWVAVSAVCVLLGCSDVTRFSTAADERYCGSIVPGPFVRHGFGPGVRMRMSFNADRLADMPGVMSTDDGMLQEAQLRPIPEISNDPLATLQFGDGRTRNLLLVAGASDGQTAFVVVSLMENGTVEVRIMRGAPLPPGVTAKPVQESPELFGVFPLVRQRGTCGF
jgi:hypothetical protein